MGKWDEVPGNICNITKLICSECQPVCASKVREDKQVKVNYKPVMTEEEQMIELRKLVAEIRDKTRKSTYNGISTSAIGLESFAIKAMKICRNEPQEVESVEIKDDIGKIKMVLRDHKYIIPIETIREMATAVGLIKEG